MQNLNRYHILTNYSRNNPIWKDYNNIVMNNYESTIKSLYQNQKEYNENFYEFPQFLLIKYLSRSIVTDDIDKIIKSDLHYKLVEIILYWIMGFNDTIKFCTDFDDLSNNVTDFIQYIPFGKLLYNIIHKRNESNDKEANIITGITIDKGWYLFKSSRNEVLLSDYYRVDEGINILYNIINRNKNDSIYIYVYYLYLEYYSNHIIYSY